MNDSVQNPESPDLAAEREADALELGRGQPDGSRAPIWEVTRPHHVPDSSYQNYLFGKAGQEDRPAWSDSMKGRAAIRLVSRGIVGAAFFTVGGRMARSSLEYYSPEAKPQNILQGIAWGIDHSFGKLFKGAFYGAARLTEKDPEKAMETAERMMTFRQSREFAIIGKDGKTIAAPYTNGEMALATREVSGILQPIYKWTEEHGLQAQPLVQKKKGRSYGAEVVSFTFDFAAASVGDATTRNLFQVFDPNVKKAWLLNDDNQPATHGQHKHIDWSKWAKSTASTTWRIFSKNQGEDWAAAIPYAFQMKFQSKLLNSAFAGKRKDGSPRFEGHDIVFDQSWNGGAYRRDFVMNPATGKKELQIVGDYQLAGAIDLHARFVGYNWYTLMFREGYDRIGHALTDWKDNGFQIHAPHLPQHFNPITATVDGLAHTGRYLAKSFIKANMYMNPAVVPFWFLRVSQSKWRGNKYIEPDINNGGRLELGAETDIFKSSQGMGLELGAEDPRLKPYRWKNYEHYPTTSNGGTVMDSIETGFSKTLNAVGAAQYTIGKKAGTAANYLAEKKLLPKSKWLNNLIQYDANVGTFIDPATNKLMSEEQIKDRVMHKGRKNFMHEYTDAAIAYTPYMFAKAELGLRVDDSKGDGKPGQMDKAIYNFMDNVASFNMPATWKSVKQMWELGIHFERDITMREGGEVKVQEPEAIKTQTLPSVAPTTTVAAGNVTREPANFGRRAYDAKPPIDEDKSWAQSVVGSNVNPAQIIPAGATRH